MQSRMVPLIFLIILMPLFLVPISFAQTTDVKIQAQDILNQTRATLGGQALKSVKSLSAVGDFRSGTGSKQASGDFHLDLLLPEKFLRIMKWSPIQDLKVTTIEAMDGRHAWTDSKEKDSHQTSFDNGQVGTSGMGRGGGRGGTNRRGGRRGATGSGGSGESSGESSAGKEPKTPAPNLRDESDTQQISSDFTCYILGLLLHWPDSAQVESIPDSNNDLNGAPADFVKIDIGNGAVIRVAIDKKTHRPVMAAYDIPNSMEGVQNAVDSSDSKFTQIQIYFSDYKPVAQNKFGNVWLPYQITKTRNGITVEDMRIKTFQLNPHLKSGLFERKRP
jgi:hypothetical protein